METANKFVKLDQFARFLDDCVDSFITYSEVETSVAEAKEAATIAETSATKAAASATQAESYSAGVAEYVNAAKVSAESAETFATAAETFSKTAEAAKEAVAESAEAAKASETAAKTSADAAAVSKEAAAVHETNTRASEQSAKASEVNAEAYAKKAATSAELAQEQVEGIAENAEKAANSAKAAKESETNAKASEANAKASETAAKTSETNAKTSETNAADSAKKAAEEVAKLAKALVYKGSVSTYAELPTENEIGDVWNITKADKTHSIKAGDNVAWSGAEWDNLGGTCDMSEYAKTADLATVATSGSYNDLTDKPEIGGDADELLFGASYTSKIAKISTWPTGLGNVALYFPNVTDIASDAFYKKYYPTPFVQTLHFSVNHRKTIKALTNYPKFGGNTEPTIIFDIDAVTMTINRGNATVVGADGEEITGDVAYIMKSTDTPVFASDGVGLLTATVNEAENFTYTVSDIPTEGNQVGINITDAGSATVTADYQYSGIYIAGLNGATTGVYCAENTPLTVFANIVTDTAFLQYSGTVTAMTDITLADCTSVPDYIKMTTGVYVVIDPATLAGGSAYFDNQNINIVHSENAETIGNETFYNCRQLTTAELKAATSIGGSAFSGCAGLTSVQLPAATSIGDNAFSGCTGLTTLELPAATSIGSYAFSGCTGLTTLQLPAATSIGNYAFSDCAGLTSLELPAATSIGDRAFSGCAGLTSVQLPAATSIGDRAFSGCAGLTSLELPAATSIGGSAFSGCTGLTSLSLTNVTELNSSAFFEWGTKDGTPDGVARTVHFAAANEETIKALSGYSNSFGYEGTLTMLFDL